MPELTNPLPHQHIHNWVVVYTQKHLISYISGSSEDNKQRFVKPAPNQFEFTVTCMCPECGAAKKYNLFEVKDS